MCFKSLDYSLQGQGLLNHQDPILKQHGFSPWPTGGLVRGRGLPFCRSAVSSSQQDCLCHDNIQISENQIIIIIGNKLISLRNFYLVHQLRNSDWVILHIQCFKLMQKLPASSFVYFREILVSLKFILIFIACVCLLFKNCLQKRNHSFSEM